MFINFLFKFLGKCFWFKKLKPGLFKYYSTHTAFQRIQIQIITITATINYWSSTRADVAICLCVFSDYYAMKVVRKEFVRSKNQAAHIKAERNILAATMHPFLVKFYYAFQTKVCLVSFRFVSFRSVALLLS